MKNEGLGIINKKLNKEQKEIKPVQSIYNEGLGYIELPRDNIVASNEPKDKWKTVSGPRG